MSQLWKWNLELCELCWAKGNWNCEMFSMADYLAGLGCVCTWACLCVCLRRGLHQGNWTHKKRAWRHDVIVWQ